MPNEINIFDHNRLLKHRTRAKPLFDSAFFLYELAISRLCERLEEFNRHFKEGIHFGVKNQKCINSLLNTNHYTTLADLQEESFTNITERYRQWVYSEEFPIPSSQQYDLITSTLEWHWINNLPLFLRKLRKALQPNGLLLANLWGERTLKELRDTLVQAEIDIRNGAAMRVSPFIEVKTLGSLLQQAGFEHPITDVETIQVSYTSLIKLFHDLRAMGETNTLIKSNTPLTRTVIERTEALLKENYGNNEGEFIVTFELVSMTALATLDQ